MRRGAAGVAEARGGALGAADAGGTEARGGASTQGEGGEGAPPGEAPRARRAAGIRRRPRADATGERAVELVLADAIPAHAVTPAR